MQEQFVIGIDFGTDSVRSVVVNALNGETIGSAVCEFSRWKQGLFCEPSVYMFRQHPLDYIESLERSVREALHNLPETVIRNIAGLTVDTTGSTPVAVDKYGMPLSLKPEFRDDPDAMFILWKDHTAVKEAEEINRLSKSWGGIDFTRYEGGVYSSEWFWSKLLHVLRTNRRVRENAWSWVEHCDWIPALLTGETNPLKINRSRCAAGHKAMWHEEFGGLPDERFLEMLDPLLRGLRSRLFSHTCTADIPAGNLSHEWAEKFGLSTNVKVGTGAFDAHLGALGGGIKPFQLIKVMGTSTCDMMVVPAGVLGDKLVSGICGQVNGSIIPGMIGLEAGQSAFGDVYAWFANLLLWPVKEIIGRMSWLEENSRKRIEDEVNEKMIRELSSKSSALSPDETGIVALDWLNGRRTPDANQALKGAISGLTLGTDAPGIFKALVEATAFGSRMINERFISEGLPVDGIIAVGGVAKKNPFVMQIVANVLNMPVQVAKADQTCALGSAMAAAVMAGVHTDFPAAQKAMEAGFDRVYQPETVMASKYDALYRKYIKFGEFVEKNEM